MNNLENSLNKIAEHILHLDEASLASLWEKYRTKVEDFSSTKEWERAVIIYYIINAVRAKNAIFNQNLLNNNNPSPQKTSPKTPKEKPYLKLVK